MEEENFASLNAEIVAETSGTSVTPQLVRVLPGKCGVGVVFVIKIANVYFEMPDKSARQTGKNYRLRSENRQKFLQCLPAV